MHPFVSMTIRFSFTGAVPVTRNGMPLFLEKTSFFSLYRTLMVSRIQRKTEKEVIFSRLESSLKFLHYAQKLQSMIRCFFQSFHLLFGMSRESFHKPAKLLPGYWFKLIFVAWPLELTVFKPFIQKKKSIALPQESFDAVTLSSAEYVQRRCKRIHMEMFLYKCCEAIYGFTHVGISTCNIYLVSYGDVT